MSAVKVDPEDSRWAADYLLSHCESYRVESAQGVLGYVEKVVWSRDDTAPVALLVRAGYGEGGLRTIGVDDVLALHPDCARIDVRAPNLRPRPYLHGFTPARRSSATVSSSADAGHTAASIGTCKRSSVWLVSGNGLDSG
jgi:hypothetical protein